MKFFGVKLHEERGLQMKRWFTNLYFVIVCVMVAFTVYLFLTLHVSRQAQPLTEEFEEITEYEYENVISDTAPTGGRTCLQVFASKGAA